MLPIVSAPQDRRVFLQMFTATRTKLGTQRHQGEHRLTLPDVSTEASLRLSLISEICFYCLQRKYSPEDPPSLRGSPAPFMPRAQTLSLPNTSAIISGNHTMTEN